MEKALEAVTQTTMAGITVGSIMGWLPALAALMSVIYYGIRIYREFSKRQR